MTDSLYQSEAVKCSEPTGQCENMDVNGYCERRFKPLCLWGVYQEPQQKLKDTA